MKEISVQVTLAPGRIKVFKLDISNKREIVDCLASLRSLIRAERKGLKLVGKNCLAQILESLIDEKLSNLTPASFVPVNNLWPNHVKNKADSDNEGGNR